MTQSVAAAVDDKPKSVAAAGVNFLVVDGGETEEAATEEDKGTPSTEKFDIGYVMRRVRSAQEEFREHGPGWYLRGN